MTAARSLTLTAPPTTEPVTLAEARLFLRVDHDAEDDLIRDLIVAAREMAEAFTRRAFLSQGWTLGLDRLPRDRAEPEPWWEGVREGAIGALTGGAYAPVPLPKPPLIAVQNVTACAPDGTPTVLPTTAYRLDLAGNRLHVTGEVGPLRATDAVAIAFTAGYGTAAASVPAAIRLAIKQTVAALYLARDCYEMPDAAQALLRPYRVMDL